MPGQTLVRSQMWSLLRRQHVRRVLQDGRDASTSPSLGALPTTSHYLSYPLRPRQKRRCSLHIVGVFITKLSQRITTLGGIAEGTVRVAAARSTLGEYPLNITGGKAHVDALSTALANVAKLVRKAIEQTAGLGDADTADLFTEVSRGIDKHLWLVEAHLHSED